jgi:ribosome maturation factor RimP
VNWNDEEIRAGIEQCFREAEDIFLVDASLNATKRGFQLIAKCESDSGITIDQLAQVNRSIHKNFTLPGLDIEKVSVEVTSPGTNFPVRTARHFRRLTGKTMTIDHSQAGVDSPLLGEIVGASDEELTIKSKDHTIVLSMGDINHGKVKLRW